MIPGFAIATRHGDTVIRKGQGVASVKIVPYAVPKSDLATAVSIAEHAGGIVSVLPFKSMNIGVVLIGTKASEDHMLTVFGSAIARRVESFGSSVSDTVFVEEDSRVISEAVTRYVSRGNEMIIIAGETSIVDVNDITPAAVRQAGGDVEVYGVPVDPGNLLMLAYIGDIPVVGAPGCIQSRSENVVDLAIPRLLAGERLSRIDLAALGHGGLMK